MSEKVIFKGTFAELVGPLFVGKKIRCNEMRWYDKDFYNDPTFNTEPKNVPDKIVPVKDVLIEDNVMSINKISNGYEFDMSLSSDFLVEPDSIIEIIE